MHRTLDDWFAKQGYVDCPACMDGYEKFVRDKEYPGNTKKALELYKPVLEYVKKNPGCSCYDLYRDLECEDIPLYLVLHNLVLAMELRGQDPYACGASSSMDDWTYEFIGGRFEPRRYDTQCQK